MKKRQGFVSNSSSSSFIVPKAHLTETQIKLIKDHINSDFERELGYYGPSDRWHIEENRLDLIGNTWMTNFNMEGYFTKIGIENAQIYFDDDWEETI